MIFFLFEADLKIDFDSSSFSRYSHDKGTRQYIKLRSQVKHCSLIASVVQIFHLKEVIEWLEDKILK